MIPLISAVGHETDVTLIDFAADVRAPTPTAAAEMAVPVRADLLMQTDSLARRLLACWQRNQETRRTELRAAARALPSADELLGVPRQQLDGMADRLSRALRANAQIHHTKFSSVAGRLGPQLLRINVERRRERLDAARLRLGTALKACRDAHLIRIARYRETLSTLAGRSGRAVRNLNAMSNARWERASQLLTAFSYRGVLARGFALVRDLNGRPLHTAGAVSSGQRVDIEFTDGRVRAVAEETPGSAKRPDSQPESKPQQRRRGGEGQGSLFGE
jgi:exodeoxyribonuclease VII large subunit